MSRRITRFVLASLSVVGAIALIMVNASAQGSGQPSTANGEWPAYNADLKGTRYSPLSQIDASNFSALEVAWRFKTDSLGPRPEYKLEGTPLEVNGIIYTTAGSRRAVVALDATSGELRWIHAEYEGARAAASP